MNAFLRSKKVLHVESQLIADGQGSFWCFCVKYVDDVATAERQKQKVDYKEVLAPAAFQRFSDFRSIRKRVAKEEDVPAYAVFTDEELANFSKLDKLTRADMLAVNGVAEKRVEKYGAHFLSNPSTT